MNTPRRRCPVCYRKIDRTIHGMIESHWDTVGNNCEGSMLPHGCAVASPRPTARWVA